MVDPEARRHARRYTVAAAVPDRVRAVSGSAAGFTVPAWTVVIAEVVAIGLVAWLWRRRAGR
jgi:hypothetical protein